MSLNYPQGIANDGLASWTYFGFIRFSIQFLLVFVAQAQVLGLMEN
jgi:hypothetical protein